MNTATQTVEIRDIDTKPTYDPYVNLEGHHSYTEFWIDPREPNPACGVSQEYKTGSTTFAHWHGHILTHTLEGHPYEEEIRKDLEDHRDLLDRIAAGYSSEWDGNNHKGRYTEAAEAAWMELCDILDLCRPHYAYAGDVGDWFHDWIIAEIKAGATDEEIQRLAHEAIETDSTVGEMDGLQVVFDESAEETLIELCKEHRNELREEAE